MRARGGEAARLSRRAHWRLAEPEASPKVEQNIGCSSSVELL
jgi:hypothetical protein